MYRTGVAVFDRKDPRKLIWRSEEPIFIPEKDWEKVGQVPNVVFVEGMVRRTDRFLFYYGGGDTNVGVAESTVKLKRPLLDRCQRALLPSNGAHANPDFFLTVDVALQPVCSRPSIAIWTTSESRSSRSDRNLC